MKKKKTEQIKARCSIELKEELENFSHAQNTTVSTLITSSLEAYMAAEKNPDIKKEFSHTVEKNILKNTVLNAMQIDSSIPEKAITRIRKEMDKI